jgi:hypothetical protein
MQSSPPSWTSMFVLFALFIALVMLFVADTPPPTT